MDLISKESFMSQKRMMLDIAAAREGFHDRVISDIGFVRNSHNLADGLTKRMSLAPLLSIFKSGELSLKPKKVDYPSRVRNATKRSRLPHFRISSFRAPRTRGDCPPCLFRNESAHPQTTPAPSILQNRRQGGGSFQQQQHGRQYRFGTGERFARLQSSLLMLRTPPNDHSYELITSAPCPE